MAKRIKRYVVIAKHANGGYVGITEESFRMWRAMNCVRLWDNHLDAEHHAKANSYGYLKFKVYRVGSTSCPIEINWRQYHRNRRIEGTSYAWRNANFSVIGD